MEINESDPIQMRVTSVDYGARQPIWRDIDLTAEVNGELTIEIASAPTDMQALAALLGVPREFLNTTNEPPLRPDRAAIDRFREYVSGPIYHHHELVLQRRMEARAAWRPMVISGDHARAVDAYHRFGTRHPDDQYLPLNQWDNV